MTPRIARRFPVGTEGATSSPCHGLTPQSQREHHALGDMVRQVLGARLRKGEQMDVEMNVNDSVVVTLSGRNLSDLLFQFLNQGHAGLERRCGKVLLQILVGKDEEHYGVVRGPCVASIGGWMGGCIQLQSLPAATPRRSRVRPSSGELVERGGEATRAAVDPT